VVVLVLVVVVLGTIVHWLVLAEVVDTLVVVDDVVGVVVIGIDSLDVVAHNDYDLDYNNVVVDVDNDVAVDDVVVVDGDDDDMAGIVVHEVAFQHHVDKSA